MTDYGATATLDRKGRVILPPDLMATDRPDPDAPNRTVRGVQRVDYLARIIGPDRRQWTAQDRLRFWAAELYRDDWAIGEDGARHTGDTLPSLRTGGPGGYGPPDGRVDALTRLRDALEALPLKSRMVVRHVVILGRPMTKVEGHSGRSHAALRSSLMAGLDALAVHYEGMGR